MAKYQTILAQLLLKDWTVLKVMATAVAVGAVGVYALVALGAAHLDVWPFQIGGALAGGVLFGVGIAVFGYCPGTGLAGSGEPSSTARRRSAREVGVQHDARSSQCAASSPART